MSSFTSLNTALSALRYNRVAMDVAGSNIANVSTEGYARRRIEGEAVGGPTQPAMWSRYTGVGDGVRVSGVNRMTDELLNVRGRREHGNQSYLDVRQASLERVENGIGEPGRRRRGRRPGPLPCLVARAGQQRDQLRGARPGARRGTLGGRRRQDAGAQRRGRGGGPAGPPAR